jgi:hypothetical protein
MSPLKDKTSHLKKTDDGSFTMSHPEHGQNYHSLEGAFFEAVELYVAASGFRDRLKISPCAVFDVGLGLAYNASATIDAWLCESSPHDVHVVSIDIDRDLIETLSTGDAPWCKGWSESWLVGCRALEPVNDFLWRASINHPLHKDRVLKWDVFCMDGSKADITSLKNHFDFVWQDPFTPDLNPSMWSEKWFSKVAQVCNPGAILMTYSVARVVRDALTKSGWNVKRIETPGSKRHWLKAVFEGM